MTSTKNTAATFLAGTAVTFRPEAGGTRVGTEYTIDNPDMGIDQATGQRMVGLVRITKGRKGYRTAYLTDLIAL